MLNRAKMLPGSSSTRWWAFLLCLSCRCVNARFSKPGNLFPNPDFEVLPNVGQNNAGWTSSYSYVSAPSAMTTAGQFIITSGTPNLWSTEAGACALLDHTFGNSTGRYWAARGSTSAPSYPLQAAVGRVRKNKFYRFSAWLSTLIFHGSGGPRLDVQVSLDSGVTWLPVTIPLLPAFTNDLPTLASTPTGCLGWHLSYGDWRAPASGDAIVRIRNNYGSADGNA